VKRRVLFILAQDPRHGGRTAEAIRIAAGLRAWKKVDVLLYLRGAAVFALLDDTSDFVDEETLTRYLPGLLATPGVVFLEAGAPVAHELSISPGVRELTIAELGGVAAECDAVSAF